ncbi:peptidoglycan editing factor PgeF [Glaciecola sp.]|uniref:peptidoglycan editing factor PgeF n=1 Tax=Glaciecola sp. MF2-115 TaxID=3384827 RepID=UPI00398A2CA9
MSHLSFIQPTWPVNKRVFCASTTVNGGVSRARFKGLNLGAHVGDDLNSVDTNRQLLLDEICKISPDTKGVSWLNQTHSTNVVHLTETMQAGTIEADGAYSNTNKLPCTVMTADCMALMISNSEGSEVAAVHAGWKGLLDGIIENALVKFSSARSDIHVWFAPSICQQHFEVGHDVASLFSDYPLASKPAPKKVDKYLLSLVDVASQKLKDLGVTHHYYSDICTYSSDYLFSHRRATHQGLPTCGRMANLILINT